MNFAAAHEMHVNRVKLQLSAWRKRGFGAEVADEARVCAAGWQRLWFGGVEQPEFGRLGFSLEK